MVTKVVAGSRAIGHANEKGLGKEDYAGPVFEQTYFQDREHKLSNYSDYSNRRYDDLCNAVIVECGIRENDLILDYGCATGALLAAFKKLGFNNVVGTDISYWAIEYGKTKLGLEKELQYYNRNLLTQDKDWLIMLDVLEHIPTEQELWLTLNLVRYSKPRGGLILRVPVTLEEGDDYYLESSRNDKTHVQKHTKKWWQGLFCDFGLHPSKYFNSSPHIWNSRGVLAVLLVGDK